MLNNTPQIAHASNDLKVNKRNWSSYNEELVARGELYFDFDFRSRWDDELKQMNNGKVGAPYKFECESFITIVLRFWKKFYIIIISLYYSFAILHIFITIVDL
jgi:hypothetical protein